MNNAKIFVGVAVGTLLGIAIGAVYTKRKYEQFIDDEIESVKDAYRANNEPDEEPLDEGEVIVPEELATSTVKKDIREYMDLANKYKEEEENEPDVEIIEHKDIKNPKIYEISEEEYGELDEFDTIECTYYADGILAEDDDERIDDISSVVGDIDLIVLDEENPLMYIRNEIRMIDFAISYDTRDYVDAIRSAHRIH